MNELDMAMTIIFTFGLLGMHYEPWSPHPPLMVLVGGVYLGARIAAHIMTHKFFRRNKHGRKQRNAGTAEITKKSCRAAAAFFFPKSRFIEQSTNRIRRGGH